MSTLSPPNQQATTSCRRCPVQSGARTPPQATSGASLGSELADSGQRQSSQKPPANPIPTWPPSPATGTPSPAGPAVPPPTPPPARPGGLLSSGAARADLDTQLPPGPGLQPWALFRAHSPAGPAPGPQRPGHFSARADRRQPSWAGGQCRRGGDRLSFGWFPKEEEGLGWGAGGGLPVPP